MSKTLFERICAKEIPAKIVYEDEWVVAVHDINPAAPTHLLIVPRRPVRSLDKATAEDQALLGHLVLKAAEVARLAGLSNGYRLVFNIGRDAGEAVPHLHGHILGGRTLGWPPG